MQQCPRVASGKERRGVDIVQPHLGEIGEENAHALHLLRRERLRRRRCSCPFFFNDDPVSGTGRGPRRKQQRQHKEKHSLQDTYHARLRSPPGSAAAG